MAMQGTISVVVCLLIGGVAAQWPTVTVQTTKGSVTGYRKDLGSNTSNTYYGQADVFVGIPYAQPPVNNLRFTFPQDVSPWIALNLSNPNIWPPQCPQKLGFPSNIKPQIQSEDCLYMNIFSPNVSATTKYPVMFFIHGGAFATGSVGVYEDDGIIRNLVNRGVLVVVIQYRLNVLGFFTTNTTEFPANLGLHDQILALKFVQREIGAFGGDKNRVTIFGQSAGACSVSVHTYSPLSVGLFQQAIMESGTALLCFDGSFEYGYWSQTAAQQFCNFGPAQWNTGNFAALKQCMQNIPFNTFLQYNVDHGPIPWAISVDGYLIPDFPRNLAARRPASYSNMPIMIGTNLDEWGFYELLQVIEGLPLEGYNSTFSAQEMAVFMSMYGDKQPLVSSVITSVYIDPLNLNDSQNTEWLKAISRWHTDGAFDAVTCREIDWWQDVNNNTNVHLYRYSYRSNIISLLSAFDSYTGWDPVGHGEEILFIFMMPQFWQPGVTQATADDFTVAEWWGKTWTDFAKTGDVTQSANWPAITPQNRYQFLEITTNTTVKQDYGHNARNVFNQVMPAVAFLTPQIPPPMAIPSILPINMPAPGARIVQTSKGQVIGFNRFISNDTTNIYFGAADVFLGIPYATPPTGPLRFAKPKEVPAWSTPVDATKWPNQCPQKGSGFPPNPELQPLSEDCLYMNIFSPDINTKTKFPVMFFIHGGGFNIGNVGTYQIDGVIRNLVSRGVVVVIFQYRINVLGFFTTNTTEFPANLGLYDQLLALKFVQSEIGAFGGDKDQVTIFGQSAGACSVSAHTLSPLSRGLFKQALMESGNAELCFDGTFEYGYWSQRVAQQMCNFTAAMWNAGTYFGQLKDCMQNMDFNNFLYLNQDHGGLPWVMTVDGDFMPDFPRNLAAQRPASYSNMPVLMGTNIDEWGFYELEQIVSLKLKLEDFNSTLSTNEMLYFMRMYGENQPLITKILTSVYVDPLNLNDSQHTEWLKVISRWHTDGAFEAGACREIDRWRDINNNTNVYLYRNTYRSQMIGLMTAFANYTGWN
uniref:Carboxylesterase type B domain-containing protein n=1 Tax=Plectus sambesii TaxID=2011161 RepID=A0A914WW12_9BILA